jgi:hypothetical protein
VRLVLKVVMQNDGDFMDVILLYTQLCSGYRQMSPPAQLNTMPCKMLETAVVASLNSRVRCRWMVSFRPRTVISRVRWTGGSVGPRACLDVPVAITLAVYCR